MRLTKVSVLTSRTDHWDGVSADCPSVASRLSATLIPELRHASVSCMGLGHQHHWVIKGNRVDWRFVHNLGICCFLD
jgi:hypothetical protein